MAERRRILLFGASGAIGTHVGREALRRGHAVTGVARRLPARVEGGLSFLRGDVTDAEAVRRLALEHDVVISATRPADGRERELIEMAQSLVAGLSGTGRRLVVVGGAATLTLPRGGQVLDDPTLVPDAWRAIAEACVAQLEVLRGATALDYIYVSPPASLEDGPRTGRYRSTSDRLVVSESGRSHIRYADLAVAILDAVERPGGGRRLTVGY